MEQNLRKTILIVCEGKASEPSYFQKLRDEVYERYRAQNRIGEINIKIEPIPPAEKEENKAFVLREGGKKRSTKSVVVPNDEPTLEEENKQQPVYYVRKAQILGLDDNTYTDVWAVYDKDQHPKHPEADVLAKTPYKGSIVNIGYTGIAFEYWILLHFENNSTAFVKSMCRVKRDHLFCGSNTHACDCGGASCVCGRIVHQGYLSYTGKRKDFDFKTYHPKVNQAISRAIQLRKNYGTGLPPFYEKNPYTSLYRLVFKLLYLPIDYTWFEFEDNLKTPDVEVKFKLVGTVLSVQIKNISKKTYIVTKDRCQLISASNEIKYFGERKNLDIGESVVFSGSIKKNGTDNYDFIGFSIASESVFITELI